MSSIQNSDPSAMLEIQRYADRERLAPYLDDAVEVTVTQDGIPTGPMPSWTSGMIANRDFFNNPAWAAQYFASENASDTLRSRYRAAIADGQSATHGDWDGKVVVDLGCGPGNLLARLGGRPKVAIGVDIAVNALKVARGHGYVPLLADVHRVPLRDGCADIVIANATLHHCDDMAQVLAEAARLVKPGGLLITDQDPQVTAWRFRGLGFLLHHAKYSPLFPLFRMLVGRPLATWDQQMARFHTEIHNQWPGDGIDLGLYRQVLEPMGFAVKLFPHNHTVGAAVLDGDWGKAPRLIRWSQRLSGMNPDRRESAQSVMCVARRSN
jgi:SAM-dependent methyltransferase